MSQDTLRTLQRIKDLRAATQQTEVNRADGALKQAEESFNQARRALELQKAGRPTHDDAIGRTARHDSMDHAMLADAKRGYETKTLTNNSKTLGQNHSAAKDRQAKETRILRDLSRRQSLTESFLHYVQKQSARQHEIADEIELEESTKRSLPRFDNEA